MNTPRRKEWVVDNGKNTNTRERNYNFDNFGKTS